MAVIFNLRVIPHSEGEVFEFQRDYKLVDSNCWNIYLSTYKLQFYLLYQTILAERRNDVLKYDQNAVAWFAFFVNGISTFVGYLIPKSYL